MRIIYPTSPDETGLNLTARVVTNQGAVLAEGIPITEVTPTIYMTVELTTLTEFQTSFLRGTYAIGIHNEQGEQIGTGKFAWDGAREVTKASIDARLWKDLEKMQIRDALGVTGDKSVATNGQLQKKSEYPDNSTIDTNNVHPNDDTIPPI